MGTLTVRENLLFSGNLRLPRKQYSTADKKKKVESIIQELGLEDCADTKVGVKCDCLFFMSRFRCRFCGEYTHKCNCPETAKGKQVLLKR